MDRALLERMVGAAVLVLLFVVFAPMLLDGRDDVPDDQQGATSTDAKTKVIVLNQPVEKPSSPVSSKQPENKTKPSAPSAASKPRAKPTAEAPSNGFAVQLGSFSSRDNAIAFAGSLQDGGYEVFVIRGSSASGSVYRVYAGPRDTRKAAEELAARLRKQGQSAMVVDLAEREGSD